MNKITSITNDATQFMVVKLEDGTFVNLTLKYSSGQQGWFYSITYGSFSLNNRRLVNSPNMLRAYRDILPFGLACNTTDGYEPVFLDDFSNGRAAFFTLNSTDIDTVETYITSYD